MSPARLLLEHDLTSAPKEVRDDVKRAGPDVPYSGASFDFLMSTELATFRDTYAAIYVDLLSKYGSKTSVVLFPLIGYFSLQTRHPCRFFALAFERLASKLKATLDQTRSIHDKWREVFADVKNECQTLSLQPFAGAALTAGWTVIGRGLSDHPVYRYYGALLSEALSKWGAKTDFLFSLPGDDRVRPVLESAFIPPLFVFPDGEWVVEAAVAKLNRLMNVPEVVAPEELRNAVTAVHARVQKMRCAALVAQYQKR
jgi:hypothetical protein